MVSFKKNLVLSAVAVLLIAVAVNAESYQSKRTLRQAAVEVAEVEEADDSECGSLEMAEEENTGGSTNTWNQGGNTMQGSGGNTWNQGGEANTHNQGGETNTYNQGGETNMYNQGGETNTYNQGGETNMNNQGGGTNMNNQNGETNTNQGETNTWGMTNAGTMDTSQFTQGEIGGEGDNQKFTSGTPQSQSNINFNSIQNTNNAGTVSPH
ncbi:hypothetical protein PPTG_03152 [Phytophthora nicotianae INRA-310]|uniref:RxLR effector protein n=1 Tax=Phytophthora nicotianae (strain INRA-310) TaxID=761204 RepID=W2R3V2_PHYN3|nr:hypothetical protein PPTG_03152 [Phytophthora nicotianae INRA-310]ETN20063.1 hypothetical protein PPTG_03152 [Phytophthora nicotianae INRA-310]